MALKKVTFWKKQSSKRVLELTILGLEANRGKIENDFKTSFVYFPKQNVLILN